MPKRSGRPSAAQTPAPKSDKIYGSSKNKRGSASTEGRSIKLSAKTIDTLEKKLKEFKEKHPNAKNVTLSDLKKVYRRGSGAYSKSHRPTITGGAPNSRAAWSFARVNKFLLKAGGTKVKAAYVQDDDLMAKGGLIGKIEEFSNGAADVSLFDESGNNVGFVEIHYDKVENLLYTPSKLEGISKKDYISNPQYNILIDELKKLGIKPTDKIHYIEQIEIFEDFRGKGYASQALSDAIDFYKDEGVEFLLLTVGADTSEKGALSNKKLIEFYTRHGFKLLKGSGNYKNRMIINLKEFAKGGKVFNDKELLAKWKKGESIGFTAESHLKSKGLIPRADGTKRKSEKYMEEGGALEELENSLILAPNGQISNLTPEQYELVRTPEFKAWFGDWENDPQNASKVVDENGEPMVVYHGSRSMFSIFNLEKSGESSTPARVGFWFTPIKKFAYNFASTTWWGESKEPIVYSLFLSIKNPKIYNSEPSDSTMIYPDSYQKFKIDIWALDGQSADRANVGGIGMMLNNQKETIKKYRESLENQGFDGIFINKTRYDSSEAGGLNNQIVALLPNQIKLTDGTNTTFDMNNPDIRYKKGGKLGDCYEAAGNFCIGSMYSPELEFVGEPYLVHAEVKGQGKAEGLRFGHAWVEDDENVYDYSNGREIVMPKVVYYAIGDIQTNDPKKYQRYTFPEARAKMLKTKHYGSWDIETEYAEGGLVAPNGKKSNLTPEQYKLVRTPEFKAWFGDWENNPENASKVVDENGEPMVVYHGTNQKFNIFDTYIANGTYHGKGGYFTSSIKDLKTNYVTSKEDYYLECFLNIKKPLIVGKKNEGTWFEKEEREIIKQNLKIFSFPRVNYAYENSWDSDNLEKIVRSEFNEDKSGRVLNSIYRDIGFDGIIYLSPNKLKGHTAPLKTKHYVAFEPNQIKLADGTNTTFNAKSDIRYEDGGLIAPNGTNNTFDANNPDIRYEDGGMSKSGQEVQCVNCGWAWNTEDSEDFDKYVCHKCGFDNTLYYDTPLKNETMNVEQEVLKEGGVVVGKRHSEMDEDGTTGERFLVESTGQVVEVEGGEGVLCSKSMQADEKLSFDGRKMTARQIASFLNHKYGGVEFEKGGEVKNVCGCKSMYYHGGELPSAKLDSLHGGEAVITVKTMESKDKFYFEGRKQTPREILSKINARYGGKSFEHGGTIDLSKHRYHNSIKMDKMLHFTKSFF